MCNPWSHRTRQRGIRKLPNFRKYRLEDDEWTVVEELVAVLERYKQATLFFSRNSASVYAVIPAMDKLDSHMNNVETREEFRPAIQAAMKLARKKMDRYWKMTDDSNTYRIATVLHPGLKLEYFRLQKWEDEWIEAAENLVREEYIDRYKDQVSPSTPAAHISVEDKARQCADDFGDISLGTAASLADELDDYLRQPVENTKIPLQWWVHNQKTYPNLHRMALDYLSIPATSTAVERVFSQGRHLLHFTRNRLSPSSTRAFLCLGSWLRCDLLAPEDLINVMKSLKKRKREDESVM